MSSETSQITRLLRGWAKGDVRSRDELVPIVYQTLHRLAQHYLAREHRAPTLQPTALVNEAYLRLIDARPGAWKCASA
jgi:ECF sigma factor